MARKRHPLRQTLKGMVKRCHHTNGSGYENYGARGITVCDRWRFGEDGKSGLELFAADMGPKPSPKHSIDRMDNDGNYEPGNCRWATAEEQANNTRANRRIEFRGETKTVTQWAQTLGVDMYLVSHRLAAGWSVERALTDPPTRHERRTAPPKVQKDVTKILGPSAANARKVACPRGHEFGTENTYYTPDGRRSCRPCEQMLQNIRRRRARREARGDAHV